MAWAEKRGPWYRVRYRDASGAVLTTPDKYRTKKEALEAAEEIDTDTRRGVFIDPKAARTSLGEWVATWRAAHHVAPGTQAKYDQYLDHHILPAFGQVSLEEIRRTAVTLWAKEQRGRYAESTVRGMVTLFSLVLSAGGGGEDGRLQSDPEPAAARYPNPPPHPRPSPGPRQARAHRAAGPGHRPACRATGRTCCLHPGRHGGVHRDAVERDHRTCQNQLPHRRGIPSRRPRCGVAA
jgi:hypothetical protein